MRPEVGDSKQHVEDAGVNFFLGGYTESVHSAQLDTTNGSMTITGTVKSVENASFLCYVPQLSTLYASVETGEPGGESGGIASWHVQDDGLLSYINTTSSCGAAPCHIGVNPMHRLLTAANYVGGNFLAVAIERDGSLGEQSACVHHSGSSAHPDRQTGPHVHATTFSPDGESLLVCDLGTDRIMRYRVQALKDGGEVSGSVAAALRPGAGPRHLTFSHDGKFAYVLTELANTIVVYAHDPSRSELAWLQEVSTLPQEYRGASTAAEVQIHPNGGFLYASNRGHDSIAVFCRNSATGLLETVGHFASGGCGPRHFQIESGGRWCIVANQFSGNTCSFRVDRETGMATATGYSLSSVAPSCVEFCESYGVKPGT